MIGRAGFSSREFSCPGYGLIGPRREIIHGDRDGLELGRPVGVDVGLKVNFLIGEIVGRLVGFKDGFNEGS